MVEIDGRRFVPLEDFVALHEEGALADVQKLLRLKNQELSQKDERIRALQHQLEQTKNEVDEARRDATKALNDAEEGAREASPDSPVYPPKSSSFPNFLISCCCASSPPFSLSLCRHINITAAPQTNSEPSSPRDRDRQHHPQHLNRPPSRGALSSSAWSARSVMSGRAAARLLADDSDGVDLGVQAKGKGARGEGVLDKGADDILKRRAANHVTGGGKRISFYEQHFEIGEAGEIFAAPSSRDRDGTQYSSGNTHPSQSNRSGGKKTSLVRHWTAETENLPDGRNANSQSQLHHGGAEEHQAAGERGMGGLRTERSAGTSSVFGMPSGVGVAGSSGPCDSCHALKEKLAAAEAEKDELQNELTRRQKKEKDSEASARGSVSGVRMMGANEALEATELGEQIDALRGRVDILTQQLNDKEQELLQYKNWVDYYAPQILAEEEGLDEEEEDNQAAERQSAGGTDLSPLSPTGGASPRTDTSNTTPVLPLPDRAGHLRRRSSTRNTGEGLGDSGKPRVLRSPSVLGHLIDQKDRRILELNGRLNEMIQEKFDLEAKVLHLNHKNQRLHEQMESQRRQVAETEKRESRQLLRRSDALSPSSKAGSTALSPAGGGGALVDRLNARVAYLQTENDTLEKEVVALRKELEESGNGKGTKETLEFLEKEVRRLQREAAQAKTELLQQALERDEKHRVDMEDAERRWRAHQSAQKAEILELQQQLHEARSLLSEKDLELHTNMREARRKGLPIPIFVRSGTQSKGASAADVFENDPAPKEGAYGAAPKESTGGPTSLVKRVTQQNEEIARLQKELAAARDTTSRANTRGRLGDSHIPPPSPRAPSVAESTFAPERIKALEAECDRLTDWYDYMKEQADELAAQLAAKDEEMASHRTELDAAKAEVEKAQSGKENAEAKLNEALAALGRIQNELADDQSRSFRSLHLRARGASMDLGGPVSARAVSAAVSDLRTDRNSLRADNATMRDDLAKMKIQLKEAVEEAEEAERRRASMSRQLEQVSDELSSLRTQHRTDRQEMESLREKLAESRHEVLRLVADLEGHQNRATERERSLTDAIAETEKQKARLREVEGELSRLQGNSEEMQILRERLADAENRLRRNSRRSSSSSSPNGKTSASSPETAVLQLEGGTLDSDSVDAADYKRAAGERDEARKEVQRLKDLVGNLEVSLKDLAAERRNSLAEKEKERSASVGAAEERDTLLARVDALKRTHTNLEKQVSSLEGQLAKSERARQETDDARDEISKRLDERDAELHRVEKALEDAKSDANLLKERADQLETKFLEYKTSRDQTDDHFTNLQREMEEITNKEAEALTARDKAQEELHQLQKVRDELEKQLEETAKELGEAEDALKKETLKKEQWEVEANKMKDETDTLRQSLADAQLSVKTLSAEQDRLREEHKLALQEIEMLHAKRTEEVETDASRQMQELEQAKQQIEQQLDELNADLIKTKTETEAQITELKNELNDAQCALARSEAKASGLSAAFQEAEERLSTLTRDLEDSNEKRQLIQSDLSALREIHRRALAEAESNLSGTREEISGLQRAIQQANLRAEDMKRQRDEARREAQHAADAADSLRNESSAKTAEIEAEREAVLARLRSLQEEAATDKLEREDVLEEKIKAEVALKARIAQLEKALQAEKDRVKEAQAYRDEQREEAEKLQKSLAEEKQRLRETNREKDSEIQTLTVQCEEAEADRSRNADLFKKEQERRKSEIQRLESTLQSNKEEIAALQNQVSLLQKESKQHKLRADSAESSVQAQSTEAQKATEDARAAEADFMRRVAEMDRTTERLEQQLSEAQEALESVQAECVRSALETKDIRQEKDRLQKALERASENQERVLQMEVFVNAAASVFLTERRAAEADAGRKLMQAIQMVCQDSDSDSKHSAHIPRTAIFRALETLQSRIPLWDSCQRKNKLWRRILDWQKDMRGSQSVMEFHTALVKKLQREIGLEKQMEADLKKQIASSKSKGAGNLDVGEDAESSNSGGDSAQEGGKGGKSLEESLRASRFASAFFTDMLSRLDPSVASQQSEDAQTSSEGNPSKHAELKRRLDASETSFVSPLVTSYQVELKHLAQLAEQEEAFGTDLQKWGAFASSSSASAVFTVESDHVFSKQQSGHSLVGRGAGAVADKTERDYIRIRAKGEGHQSVFRLTALNFVMDFLRQTAASGSRQHEETSVRMRQSPLLSRLDFDKEEECLEALRQGIEKLGDREGEGRGSSRGDSDLLRALKAAEHSLERLLRMRREPLTPLENPPLYLFPCQEGSLRQEVERLQEFVQGDRERKEEADMEIVQRRQSLEKKLITARQEVESLQDALAVERQKASDAAVSAEQAVLSRDTGQKVLASQREETANLQEALSTAQRDLESMRGQISSLTADLNRAQAREKVLSLELSDAQGQIEQARSSANTGRKALESEVSGLQDRLRHSEKATHVSEEEAEHLRVAIEVHKAKERDLRLQVQTEGVKAATAWSKAEQLTHADRVREWERGFQALGAAAQPLLAALSSQRESSALTASTGMGGLLGGELPSAPASVTVMGGVPIVTLDLDIRAPQESCARVADLLGQSAEALKEVETRRKVVEREREETEKEREATELAILSVVDHVEMIEESLAHGSPTPLPDPHGSPQGRSPMRRGHSRVTFSVPTSPAAAAALGGEGGAVLLPKGPRGLASALQSTLSPSMRVSHLLQSTSVGDLANEVAHRLSRMVEGLKRKNDSLAETAEALQEARKRSLEEMKRLSLMAETMPDRERGDARSSPGRTRRDKRVVDTAKLDALLAGLDGCLTPHFVESPLCVSLLETISETEWDRALTTLSNRLAMAKLASRGRDGQSDHSTALGGLEGGRVASGASQGKGKGQDTHKQRPYSASSADRRSEGSDSNGDPLRSGLGGLKKEATRLRDALAESEAARNRLKSENTRLFQEREAQGSELNDARGRIAELGRSASKGRSIPEALLSLLIEHRIVTGRLKSVLLPSPSQEQQNRLEQLTRDSISSFELALKETTSADSASAAASAKDEKEKMKRLSSDLGFLHLAVEEVAKMREELSLGREKTRSLQTDVDASRRAQAMLEQQLETCRVTSQSLRGQLAEREQAAENAKEELRQAKERMTGEKAAIDGEIASLQGQFSALEDKRVETKALKERLAAKDQHIADQTRRVEELERQIDRAEDTRQKDAAQHSRRQVEVQLELEDVKRQLEDQKQRFAELEEISKDVCQRVKAQSAETERLSAATAAELQMVQIENARLQAEIKSSEETAERFRVRLQEKTAELAGLSQKVGEVQDALSNSDAISRDARVQLEALSAAKEDDATELTRLRQRLSLSERQASSLREQLDLESSRCQTQKQKQKQWEQLEERRCKELESRLQQKENAITELRNQVEELKKADGEKRRRLTTAAAEQERDDVVGFLEYLESRFDTIQAEYSGAGGDGFDSEESEEGPQNDDSRAAAPPNGIRGRKRRLKKGLDSLSSLLSNFRKKEKGLVSSEELSREKMKAQVALFADKLRDLKAELAEKRKVFEEFQTESEETERRLAETETLLKRQQRLSARLKEQNALQTKALEALRPRVQAAERKVREATDRNSALVRQLSGLHSHSGSLSPCVYEQQQPSASSPKRPGSASSDVNVRVTLRSPPRERDRDSPVGKVKVRVSSPPRGGGGGPGAGGGDRPSSVHSSRRPDPARGCIHQQRAASLETALTQTTQQVQVLESSLKAHREALIQCQQQTQTAQLSTQSAGPWQACTRAINTAKSMVEQEALKGSDLRLLRVTLQEVMACAAEVHTLESLLKGSGAGGEFSLDSARRGGAQRGRGGAAGRSQRRKESEPRVPILPGGIDQCWARSLSSINQSSVESETGDQSKQGGNSGVPQTLERLWRALNVIANRIKTTVDLADPTGTLAVSLSKNTHQSREEGTQEVLRLLDDIGRIALDEAEKQKSSQSGKIVPLPPEPDLSTLSLQNPSGPLAELLKALRAQTASAQKDVDGRIAGVQELEKQLQMVTAQRDAEAAEAETLRAHLFTAAKQAAELDVSRKAIADQIRKVEEQIRTSDLLSPPQSLPVSPSKRMNARPPATSSSECDTGLDDFRVATSSFSRRSSPGKPTRSSPGKRSPVKQRGGRKVRGPRNDLGSSTDEAVAGTGSGDSLQEAMQSSLVLCSAMIRKYKKMSDCLRRERNRPPPQEMQMQIPSVLQQSGTSDSELPTQTEISLLDHQPRGNAYGPSAYPPSPPAYPPSAAVSGSLYFSHMSATRGFSPNDFLEGVPEDILEESGHSRTAGEEEEESVVRPTIPLSQPTGTAVAVPDSTPVSFCGDESDEVHPGFLPSSPHEEEEERQEEAQRMTQTQRPGEDLSYSLTPTSQATGTPHVLVQSRSHSPYPSASPYEVREVFSGLAPTGSPLNHNTEPLGPPEGFVQYEMPPSPSGRPRSAHSCRDTDPFHRNLHALEPPPEAEDGAPSVLSSAGSNGRRPRSGSPRHTARSAGGVEVVLSDFGVSFQPPDSPVNVINTAHPQSPHAQSGTASPVRPRIVSPPKRYSQQGRQQQQHRGSDGPSRGGTASRTQQQQSAGERASAASPNSHVYAAQLVTPSSASQQSPMKRDQTSVKVPIRAQGVQPSSPRASAQASPQKQQQGGGAGERRGFPQGRGGGVPPAGAARALPSVPAAALPSLGGAAGKARNNSQ
uniref:Uncharacterized protein n=1 Tax=Chromera velia CCMP2878 TaxID=1169474 RepID=A0A0G4FVA5_9ALVE